MRIPLCPLPLEKAKRVSKKFSGFADSLSKFSSTLKLNLDQAEIPLTPKEYLSITIFTSLFVFVVSTLVVVLLTVNRLEIPKSIGLSLIIGIVFFVVSFFYLKTYPKLLVKKKVKNLEKNLLHTLKHLLIQIKSGVPLYDAFLSITRGNYGAISSEFEKLIKNVDTGTSMESGLEQLSVNNPSLNFRRSIWQISNGMKAGSDIGNLLREIINTLSQQQVVATRRYGSQLNPLTLVYMMIAVILPSLGITFLFIFSAFSPIAVTEMTFWIILVVLAILQFMYIGIIKSRRPYV